LADIWINILGDATKLKGELDKAGSHVSKFGEKIGAIGKTMTIVGGAVTAAFTAIVLKTVQVGDQFDKMSLRTGIAVEDLSSLAHACNISGTSIEGMEIGLKFLTRGMDDASKGTGEAKEAFEELGISVVDVEGNLRPTIDVLKEAATKIAAIENPTKQAALAMEIFGARSGTQLIPLLKMGGAGIEELMEKAKELGITMSTEAASAAAEFKDRLTDLKGSLAGAGRAIGEVLIPPLTTLAEKAIEIVKKIKEWADAHKPLIEAIILIGAKLGVLAAVGGPILMAVSAFMKMQGAITALGTISAGPIGIMILAFAGASLGLIKLSEYLDTAREKAYRFKMGLDDIPLEKLDKDIENIVIEINGLEKAMKEIDWGTEDAMIATIKYREYEAQIFELERQLGILYKTREELVKVEEKEIIVTETLNEKIMEAVILNEKLDDALKTIADRLFELTHTEIENNIRKLEEQKKAYIALGVSQEIVDKWFKEEIRILNELKPKVEDTTGVIGTMKKMMEAVGITFKEELPKLSFEFEKMTGSIIKTVRGVEVDVPKMMKSMCEAVGIIFEEKLPQLTDNFMSIWDTLKINFKNNIIDPIIGYLTNNLANAISGLLGGMGDFEWSWKNFWEGLKNVLINAVAAMIAKLVILAGFSWLIKLLGWPVSWLSWDKGGGVGYNFGGEVKKFQFGGMADTIPARLTVGEYVIAKPMTDFIKRFKAIPQNLIDAVVGGFPTPTPALSFAGGGSVGTSNITAQGFGETKIYVDIHDNKISDDLDIRKLAMTVSSEILKKIQQNKRY